MQKKIGSIRVGIWIDETYRPQEGGGYSYYEKLIRHIDKFPFDPRIEFVFLCPSREYNFQKEQLVIGKRRLVSRWLFKASALFSHPRLQFRLKQRSFKREIAKLAAGGIDLIYYPIPSQDKVPGFPFIATSWDIGHRSTYPFPEFGEDGGFIIREQLHKQDLPQALFVFTESQSGKKELVNFLQIPEDRIKVVPLFAGDSVVVEASRQADILKKFNLQSHNYFYYPAQFWAHKNHTSLLLAFAQIAPARPGLKLVLSGSDKGNKTYISTLAAKLQIDDRILFPGFVSPEELNTLYSHAVALVMPTFLGPTNMPLLEARELNCAVLCSNHEGHKEMLQDGAWYFDPTRHEELGHQMEAILDPAQRQQLVSKAQAIKSASSFSIEVALQRIEEHMLAAIPIRSCWP